MTTIDGQLEGHPWAFYAQEMPFTEIYNIQSNAGSSGDVWSYRNVDFRKGVWKPKCNWWGGLVAIEVEVASSTLFSLCYERDESFLVNEIQPGVWIPENDKGDYIYSPPFGYADLSPSDFPTVGQWVTAVTQGVSPCAYGINFWNMECQHTWPLFHLLLPSPRFAFFHSR